MIRRRKAVSLSTAVAVAVVVIVIVIGVAAVLQETRQKSSVTTPPTKSTTSLTVTTTTTTTSPQTQLKPENSSVLVDDSQTSAPDGLDPAFGFFSQDEGVFYDVYQELLVFNGSSVTQMVPELAENYTSFNNYMNYTFNIRPHVKFSTGYPLTASTVWFSFVRELFMGQDVGWGNYIGLTLNATQFFNTGYAFPWGTQNAVAYATGVHAASTNLTLAAKLLGQMLSNWNPSNATIEKLMSYPHQAYVVTGPMTFQINLMVHYAYFPTVLQGWWGAVVDPAYVDAHGGVQANTVNSYFNNNGGPGTGPYMIKSVGSSLSTVVLVRNPTYWNQNSTTDIPTLAPAHIPEIVINYGLSHTDRVEDFAANKAQISYVSIPFFAQMYNSYEYRNMYSFSQILRNFGPTMRFLYFAFNTQRFPTNNRDYRYALVHAINYTQLLDQLYSFNGSVYAQEYYGPVSPSFPQYQYLNHTNYQFNLNIAAKYLNKSMWQMGYQVVMPNGTVLGNPNAPVFPAQTFQTVAPLTAALSTETEIIESGFRELGIPFTVQLVTSTVYEEELASAQSSPQYVLQEYGPDWPDPYNQILLAAYTTYDSNAAWMNVSKINNILFNISYLTNPSQQLREAQYVYNYTYYYAPYAWMPNPDATYFVQPYVHGLVWNVVYTELIYDTMYYQPS
ncbi:MAG: ABC transporter substrate-binding protein [Thermoprotei archaeon]